MSKSILYYIFILSFYLSMIFAEIGYVRQTEMSFCMSECSQFYLESENGEFVSNISFGDLSPDLYLNRFVEISGNQIFCIECDAIEITEIILSDECQYPVDCFSDPCLSASDCDLNTPVECISNYCGGCYADFYDLSGNLVNCSLPELPQQCDDLSDVFFGICDMFLGYAVVDGICQGVSGCDWIVNQIDYSDIFFNSIQECEQNCYDEPYLCEDIQYDYDQLFFGEFNQCEFNNECESIWGDCGVGLGNCHYSVNPFYFNSSLVDDLVGLWLYNDCMEWVCDCTPLPNSICNDGLCELAYCYDDNPAGCFFSGCPEGYQCIENPSECIPSQCFCDEFYGEWFCTEDCGGGTCSLILQGDINNDGILNVSDIIIIVNMILGISLIDMMADINGDESIDIFDVVMIVNIILNR